jgi:hypothetical protein
MMHNTHFSQYIPCTAMHYVTGTYTQVAGEVAGTIAINRAAHNSTALITIPIIVPSNSVALQGAKLASIEIDYEHFTAEPTSMTWTLNKVTRGADGAVAVVAAVTKTNTLSAADGKSVNEHKEVITITTPVWVDNDEYFLLELSMPSGAGGQTFHMLGAVANFTFKG